jgi:D-aspartate ligase
MSIIFRTNDAPLAVVVGSDLNALGVVRSLSAGRVPIAILGPAAGCAMRSRFGHKLPLPATDGESLVASLVDIAAKAPKRPMLFLTEEKSVATVSDRRADLDGLFHIRLPSRDTLDALLDKTEFQRLAQSSGARIPSGASLRSPRDLDAVSKLRFPCVLKPASKNYAYGARFSKAYVVTSVDEVERLYGEIAPVMPDMIVQEWIDGEDSDIFFCLQYIGRNNDLVASFVGRKIRSWPPRIGGTASCIAAPDRAKELTDATTQFFRSVQFQGMGSMEFKRDRRDGQFYMVEPTVGRTDFQEEVATVNDVNIPLAA